jgi:putative spermidine/putrescine transport system ATP-binding protein
MSQVALVNVSKTYGANVVVDNLNLTVEDGEFVTLLGASGSGKTTCLRMLAGFQRPDRGKVMLGGVDATALPPYRRNTGMVFQQYALFPHLTVAENVAYGLKARRIPKAESQSRTLEALHMVHLQDQAGRYPAQLSGGQKQRVALARAVVIRPSILLLDEPLSALDAKLREELQGEIRRIQKQLGITTLFVTHDQGEALAMSDRVAIMQNGQILQVAPPVTLYQRPVSRYVATFLGKSNFLAVVVLDRHPSAAGNTRAYTVSLVGEPHMTLEVEGVEQDFAEGEHAVLAIRPENTRVQSGARNQLLVSVEKLNFTGDRWVAECRRGSGPALDVVILGREAVPRAGERIAVGWAPDHGMLMRAEYAHGN